jgi:predicted cobalt transporter CbtA
MFAAFLGRGMVAGLLAGLLCGFFALFFGEPAVDGAIHLEEAASAAEHEDAPANHGEDEELFSRTTQKVGLFFATGLFGVSMGGIFGMVYAYVRSRLVSDSEWSRSLSLASAAFLGVFLIPFVKYPANPPTVGDPNTIGSRTAEYFTMMTLSLVVVVGAWYVAMKLREREVSTPVRQLAVVLGSVLIVGALIYVLPAGPDPGEFPAALLWEFRLSSLGTQLVFWAGLGVLFGLLGEKANRRHLAPAK